jgi:hypothetical protein
LYWINDQQTYLKKALSGAICDKRLKICCENQLTLTDLNSGPEKVWLKYNCFSKQLTIFDFESDPGPHPDSLMDRRREWQSDRCQHFSGSRSDYSQYALKYGLIPADIGSNMYMSCATNPRRNNNELRQLGKVKVSDFELVKINLKDPLISTFSWMR